MINHRYWNPAQYTASATLCPQTIHLGDTFAILVYYRLYSPTGPMPANHRVYSHNPYLGQIDATHISPPHNARSIKRCIARHEEIVDLTVTDIILFSALSSQVPMRDQDFVQILAGTGSGSTPQEPMALVVTDASDFVNANNSIEDGTYLIGNQDKSCFWAVDRTPMQNIYFMAGTVDSFRTTNYFQKFRSRYQRLSGCSTI
jgi:hypothetical protein